MQHRWIVRNGEKVLQYNDPLTYETDEHAARVPAWRDVPTVVPNEEPKREAYDGPERRKQKPTRIEWDGEDNGRPMRSCCQCGETIPVDFLGAEMHWCQPKYVPKPEPKKVSVEEELTRIIRGMRDEDAYCSDDIAKAAIEFFKKRARNFGYKLGEIDALFGERE